MGLLSTGLSTTNSTVASLSTSSSTSIGSLSTGLSTTNSNVSALSGGLSSTNSALSALSSATSTSLGSLSTSLSTTDGNLTSLSTSLSAIKTSASNVGNSTAAALGGGATYDPATGTISAPSYTTYNANGTTSIVNNVGAAIDSLNRQGIQYFHANSSAPDSIATGADSVAIGPNALASVDNSVAIGNGAMTSGAVPVSSTTVGGLLFGNYAGSVPIGVFSVGAPGAERQITNVAAGRVTAASTDAVNGSQLYAANSTVASLSTGLAATDNNLASLSTSTSTSIGALSSGLSTTNNTVASLSTSTSSGLGSLSTGLSTTNIAVASLSTGVTNINNQLSSLSTSFSSSTRSAANTAGIDADMKGNGSDVPTVTRGSNSVAIGAHSNDAGRSNVVSVGNATQQRQITNVAAGTEGTDAVNVNQLNTLSTSMSQSLAAQQTQLTQLGSALNQTQQALQETNTMARQGIAAVGAIASIPRLDRDANFGMGVGTSTFNGQKAMALNMQARITDNLKALINGGFSGTQKVIGVGALYQWK
ncbi:cell surface protein [Burkholderia ubonensis]|nr:cell surface protein [Burkholderia ubonensis]